MCNERRTCKKCEGSHPTILHRDTINSDDSNVLNRSIKVESLVCNKVVSSGVISMSVVPVVISFKDSHGEREEIVYAMLDNCSTGTFIEESILRKLGAKGVKTTVTVTTMNGTEWYKDCEAVEGLKVKKFTKDAGQKPVIELPKTFCTSSLPINRSEIPSPEKLSEWVYLQKIFNDIPQEDPSIPIGLLIGGNCPKALEPLEVIPSENQGPFALKSMLGWCIIGPISAKNKGNNVNLKCNRIAVTDVSTNQLSKHHLAFKEDNKFLTIMNSEGNIVEGHYELPLPFRNHEVRMPNNKTQAVHRAASIKRKFMRNKQFYNDYTKFMNNLLEKGYAEVSDADPVENGNTWFIPHHGIYHPKKTGKIRVVFDCSAPFQGISLNSELLQGPDLTNHLIGVLIRFRKGTCPPHHG